MATIEISYEDEAFEADAERDWVKTQLESILRILEIGRASCRERV